MISIVFENIISQFRKKCNREIKKIGKKFAGEKFFQVLLHKYRMFFLGENTKNGLIRTKSGETGPAMRTEKTGKFAIFPKKAGIETA